MQDLERCSRGAINEALVRCIDTPAEDRMRRGKLLSKSGKLFHSSCQVKTSRNWLMACRKSLVLCMSGIEIRNHIVGRNRPQRHTYVLPWQLVSSRRAIKGICSADLEMVNERGEEVQIARPSVFT